MPVCLFWLTKGQVFKIFEEPQRFLPSRSVKTENKTFVWKIMKKVRVSNTEKGAIKNLCMKPKPQFSTTMYGKRHNNLSEQKCLPSTWKGTREQHMDLGKREIQLSSIWINACKVESLICK